MQDPTTRVRRKPKGDRPKKAGMGGLPEFSAPNYEDVEKNNLWQIGADSGELDYLKRLKLRQNLAGTAHDRFVPPASDRELAVGRELENLNALNNAQDERSKVALELIFARFNTRSIWQVAQEIAHLKLQKQSINEIDALVSNNVQGFYDNLVIGRNAAAQQREQFARPPRHE